MRFHHISICAVLGLIFASASLAGQADELERGFAEQLDRSVELQISTLVSQKLADEMEAIRIPSARALPHGELSAARLVCKTGPEGAVDCTVAPDPTQGALLTSLSIKH
jgi:hypothetical protein